MSKKILIVTDAWHPQVNGVVRTYEKLIEELEKKGHEVKVISPDMFLTVPLPTYNEIKLALPAYHLLKRHISSFDFDHLHIATEGSLGMMANVWARKNLKDKCWTTSFHTMLPDYINKRLKLPTNLIWPWLKWFHNKSSVVLVPTQSIADILQQKGISNIKIWRRGVDTDIFYPKENVDNDEYQKPVWVYSGRVAIEKNLPSFLDLELEGTKIVIGDGPDRKFLQEKYPDVIFTGFQTGDDLATWMNKGDVFVFPSKTDTFGIVLLEAAACGLNIAAYPVAGPKDIFAGTKGIAALNDNLYDACMEALKLSPKAAVDFAKKWQWNEVANEFLDAFENYRDYQKPVIVKNKKVNKMKKNVAIVYGGFSNEAEVSLVSGKSIIKSLGSSNEKYNFIGYRLTKDIAGFITFLKKEKIDIVFNGLHGTYGEDGCIQGLLNMLGIPYTHSGVQASAIAMDKVTINKYLANCGILVAKNISGLGKDIISEFPCNQKKVVKPTSEGSSVGVFIVGENQELDADKFAPWLNKSMMVEDYIPGKELSVAVLDGKALRVTEITTTKEFYDFNAKYDAGGSEHILLDDNLDMVKRAKEIAQDVWNALDFRGLIRVDFRFDGENHYVIDINTLPGFTPTSLAAEQAQSIGISYKELCLRLIDTALKVEH